MSKVKATPEEDLPMEEPETGDWEVVPSVGGRQPLSAVLTVRFTQAELRRIRDIAKTRSESMGDVVRAAVQTQLEPVDRPVLTMGFTTTSRSTVNIHARSGIVTFGEGIQAETPA